MNQASLFQSQRSFSLFLGTAGILLLFSTLFFLNNHVLAAVAAPLILNPVFIHLNSRKYHFSYDKEHICWHFPNSECEKSVKLSDPSYHITMNWKGLTFEGQSQRFEISLDQFWKKDRKRLYQKLKAYYAEQEKQAKEQTQKRDTIINRYAKNWFLTAF